ncbi:LacI family DNA-binding transcriptional regulator [Rariglobus hedericola]|nr:LacI family DNA-binding transcriptional regulator [Rariglobus hedericola]
MRQLARELGISAATVSLALRSDSRITPETTARVKSLAASRGYHADPVVAEGMSRARRHDFYRETIGWFLDVSPQAQPWLGDLFSSAGERGRMLGYQIEFFTVDFEDKAALRRTARMCRARGIRGLLLGPLEHALVDPVLPWGDFSWVTIGQSLVSPALHRVGRDYDKDISFALSRLRAQGWCRPGFVDDNTMHHLMGLPLLRAALVHYHRAEDKMSDAYYTAKLDRPADFARWLKRNRPDSLVLGKSFEERAVELHRLVAHLPQVELSPPDGTVCTQARFVRDYASMGHSAMTLLHRLLADGEKGIPRNEQTIVVSSAWQEPGPAELPG